MSASSCRTKRTDTDLVSLGELANPKEFKPQREGIALKPRGWLLHHRKPLVNVKKLVKVASVSNHYTADGLNWRNGDLSLSHPTRRDNLIHRASRVSPERWRPHQTSSTKASLKFFNIHFNGVLGLLTPSPIAASDEPACRHHGFESHLILKTD